VLRSAVSQMLWVGWIASALFGLALVFGLVFGAASMAFGANGGNFILGQNNAATALTRLAGNVPGGPALQVINNETDAGSRGLQVNVAPDKAPILVNSTAGKATNLNADQLDGRDSTGFYAAGSKVDDSSHADSADSATSAQNADELDGKDSSDFVPSLWARVKDDGTLLAGKGATSVVRGGGGYFVRFDRDISNCAYIATVGQQNVAYGDPGEIQAIHSTGNMSPDRDVYVAMSDSETGALARGFSLVVVC
jgi:hypothetical protein